MQKNNYSLVPWHFADEAEKIKTGNSLIRKQAIGRLTNLLRVVSDEMIIAFFFAAGFTRKRAREVALPILDVMIEEDTLDRQEVTMLLYPVSTFYAYSVPEVAVGSLSLPDPFLGGSPEDPRKILGFNARFFVPWLLRPVNISRLSPFYPEVNLVFVEIKDEKGQLRRGAMDYFRGIGDIEGHLLDLQSREDVEHIYLVASRENLSEIENAILRLSREMGDEFSPQKFEIVDIADPLVSRAFTLKGVAGKPQNFTF